MQLFYLRAIHLGDHDLNDYENFAKNASEHAILRELPAEYSIHFTHHLTFTTIPGHEFASDEGILLWKTTYEHTNEPDFTTALRYEITSDDLRPRSNATTRFWIRPSTPHANYV